MSTFEEQYAAMIKKQLGAMLEQYVEQVEKDPSTPTSGQTSEETQPSIGRDPRGYA